MRDIEYDRDSGTEYECFACGLILETTSGPGTCPECEAELRHRRTPLE